MDKRGNITNPCGDTFYLTMANITENNVAFDFTGCTALAEIKSKESDTTALVTLTESTGIILNATLTTITVPFATMVNIPKGDYVFRFVLIRADGRKETWFHYNRLRIN
jgi:hypothetical protein